jgi:hypothetical protein
MSQANVKKTEAAAPASVPAGPRRRRAIGKARRAPPRRTPLRRLAQLALSFPVNPALPRDGAANHDHYLYGTAKQT